MSRVYVGTYTQREEHVDGKGEGIYCCELEEATGRLTLSHVKRGIVNPSFLALAGGVLYAVSEVANPGTGGWVYAYRIDSETGHLTLLGRQPSLGTAPCHVSVVQGNILVANYGGGSVTVIPRGPRGSLGAPLDHVVHAGSSVNAGRQEAPHPHAIVPDRKGRFALVPDLGTDEVVIYRYEADGGRLERFGAARLRPGAGPRHITIDRGGRHAYLISELDSTVTAFGYSNGTLTQLQTMRALPASWQGTPSGADIHIEPSGHYLYASLRGPACIAVFRMQKAGLTLLGHTSTCGRTPRNFGIHPAGRFLIAANQDSDSLEVFRIDGYTGLLTHTGYRIRIPNPACVAFG